jgi:hypothetical protein
MRGAARHRKNLSNARKHLLKQEAIAVANVEYLIGGRWRLARPVHRLAQEPGVAGILEVADRAGEAQGNAELAADRRPRGLCSTGCRRRSPLPPAAVLAPISSVAATADVLVVHPSTNISTVQELIAFLKSNPGTPAGHGGIGTGPNSNRAHKSRRIRSSIRHEPLRDGCRPVRVTDIRQTIPGLRLRSIDATRSNMAA